VPSAGAIVCKLAEFDSDACIVGRLKSDSELANSSIRIAAENASEIDIFFLKYGIFINNILLQYGLHLFNPYSLGSFSSTIAHLAILL
jgi:hypothetical protein